MKAKRLIAVGMLLMLGLTGCTSGKKNVDDQISQYLKENNYPKAVGALRDNPEYENYDGLMKQLRYNLDGASISCNYTYVAAVNDKRGVDAVLGDYGFADNIKEWKQVYSVSNNDLYVNALTEDNVTLTSAPEQLESQETEPSWTDVEKAIQSSYRNDYIGLKSDGTVRYQCESMSTKEQEAMAKWEEVADISAGFSVYALTENGTVLSSDPDMNKKLSSWSDIVAISASLDVVAGLKKDGTVVLLNGNQYGSNDVSSWSDIVAIDTCGYFTIGLKSDGTLAITEYADDGLDIGQASEFKNLYVPYIV